MADIEVQHYKIDNSNSKEDLLAKLQCLILHNSHQVAKNDGVKDDAFDALTEKLLRREENNSAVALGKGRNSQLSHVPQIQFETVDNSRAGLTQFQVWVGYAHVHVMLRANPKNDKLFNVTVSLITQDGYSGSENAKNAIAKGVADALKDIQLFKGNSGAEVEKDVENAIKNAWGKEETSISPSEPKVLFQGRITAKGINDLFSKQFSNPEVQANAFNHIVDKLEQERADKKAAERAAKMPYQDPPELLREWQYYGTPTQKEAKRYMHEPTLAIDSALSKDSAAAIRLILLTALDQHFRKGGGRLAYNQPFETEIDGEKRNASVLGLTQRLLEDIQAGNGSLSNISRTLLISGDPNPDSVNLLQAEIGKYASAFDRHVCNAQNLEQYQPGKYRKQTVVAVPPKEPEIKPQPQPPAPPPMHREPVISVIPTAPPPVQSPALPQIAGVNPALITPVLPPVVGPLQNTNQPADVENGGWEIPQPVLPPDIAAKNNEIAALQEQLNNLQAQTDAAIKHGVESGLKVVTLCLEIVDQRLMQEINRGKAAKIAHDAAMEKLSQSIRDEKQRVEQAEAAKQQAHADKQQIENEKKAAEERLLLAQRQLGAERLTYAQYLTASYLLNACLVQANETASQQISQLRQELQAETDAKNLEAAKAKAYDTQIRQLKEDAQKTNALLTDTQQQLRDALADKSRLEDERKRLQDELQQSQQCVDAAFQQGVEKGIQEMSGRLKLLGQRLKDEMARAADARKQHLETFRAYNLSVQAEQRRLREIDEKLRESTKEEQEKLQREKMLAERQADTTRLLLQMQSEGYEKFITETLDSCVALMTEQQAAKKQIEDLKKRIEDTSQTNAQGQANTQNSAVMISLLQECYRSVESDLGNAKKAIENLNEQLQAERQLKEAETQRANKAEKSQSTLSGLLEEEIANNRRNQFGARMLEAYASHAHEEADGRIQALQEKLETSHRQKEDAFLKGAEHGAKAMASRIELIRAELDQAITLVDAAQNSYAQQAAKLSVALDEERKKALQAEIEKKNAERAAGEEAIRQKTEADRLRTEAENKIRELEEAARKEKEKFSESLKIAGIFQLILLSACDDASKQIELLQGMRAAVDGADTEQMGSEQAQALKEQLRALENERRLVLSELRQMKEMLDGGQDMAREPARPYNPKPLKREPGGLDVAGSMEVLGELKIAWKKRREAATPPDSKEQPALVHVPQPPVTKPNQAPTSSPPPEKTGFSHSRTMIGAALVAVGGAWVAAKNFLFGAKESEEEKERREQAGEPPPSRSVGRIAAGVLGLALLGGGAYVIHQAKTKPDPQGITGWIARTLGDIKNGQSRQS